MTDDLQETEDAGDPMQEALGRFERPEPITLRSRHDASLTVRALEAHQLDLTKKAKGLLDAKYPREARVLSADAAAIEHAILPAIRGQMAIEFVTEGQLTKAIDGALRRAVFKGFEGMGDPKVVFDYNAIAHRRERTLEDLTRQVAMFALDVARSAFDQGYAARLATPEALVMGAIDTLRAAGA